MERKRGGTLRAGFADSESARIQKSRRRIRFYVNRWKGGGRMKGGGPVEMVVHYPETEEAQRELAKCAATVHAQTVVEKLSALSCPVEQRAALMDAVIAKRRSCTG